MTDKNMHSRTAKESTIFSKRGTKMESQIFFQYRTKNRTKIDNDKKKRKLKMSETFIPFLTSLATFAKKNARAMYRSARLPENTIVGCSISRIVYLFCEIASPIFC